MTPDSIHDAVFPDLRNADLASSSRVPYKSLQPIGYTRAVGTGDNAEFIAYLEDENILAVCNDEAGVVDLYEMTAAATFTWLKNLTLSGAPQSLAYANNILAVASDVEDMRGNRVNGAIDVFIISTIKQKSITSPAFSVDVQGHLPDHVSFTPDGRKLCVAIEAEPVDDTSSDEEGGVTVITAADWTDPATYVVTFVGFTNFDAAPFTKAGVKAAGVHLPFVAPVQAKGVDFSVSQDLEPEYIHYSGDSTKAFVVCQEANTIAVLRLDTDPPIFEYLLPLGLKSYETFAVDVSDRETTQMVEDPDDNNELVEVGMRGNLKHWKGVFGMFQPDTIRMVNIAGTEYIFTANEGDSKDYADDGGASEEFRFKDDEIKGNVDPAAVTTAQYPTIEDLDDDAALGRLKVTAERGYNATTNVYDRIVSFGARSFSIWKVTGAAIELVWDSGSQLEDIAFKTDYTTLHFNSDGGDAFLHTADKRSDDKVRAQRGSKVRPGRSAHRAPAWRQGPEPESLTVFTDGWRFYLVGGAERSSMLYVWDVTDPTKPIFLSVNVDHDCSTEGTDRVTRMADPEALQYVPATKNPTGKNILIANGAVSGSLHVFEVVDSAGTDYCARPPSPPPPSPPPPSPPPPSPPPPSPPPPSPPPPSPPPPSPPPPSPPPPSPPPSASSTRRA